MPENTISPILFLNDKETDFDLINNAPVSDTILNLIKNSGDNPITIGIHGDWGSGKSSILCMIEKDLLSTDDFLCIRFNGWQFQGFENAKIAIIEQIVTSLANSKKISAAAKDKLIKLFNCINWLKVGKLVADGVIVAQGGIPVSQFLDVPDDLETWDASNKKEIKDKIDDFKKLFNELLVESKYKKVIILIDDLDRCLPETVIETLEAIKLFLFMPNTVFDLPPYLGQL